MLDSRNRCKGHDPTSSVRVILNTNHEFLEERDTKPTRWRERKKRKPEKRREKRDFLTGKERGAGSSRWLCAKPSTTSVEATQRRYPRLSLRSQLLSRLAHDSSGLCRRISSSLSLSLSPTAWKVAQARQRQSIGRASQTTTTLSTLCFVTFRFVSVAIVNRLKA